MVFLLILCWQTYLDVAKASTHNICKLPAGFYECLITVVITLRCSTATHQKFLYYAMLTYSGGTYRSGELCYDCSISSDLTEMVNLPTRIPDFDSHSPALLEIFIFSDTSVFKTWLWLISRKRQ